MSDYTWQARSFEAPEDFAREVVRLYIWRHRPDGLTEFVTADGLIRTIPEGTVSPPDAGLVLHADQWAAIERAVEPQAHNAEIRRLEEALAVERRRVDALLLRERTA